MTTRGQKPMAQQNLNFLQILKHCVSLQANFTMHHAQCTLDELAKNAQKCIFATPMTLLHLNINQRLFFALQVFNVRNYVKMNTNQVDCRMLFLPSNNCKKNFEFTALKKDKIGYMYLELIKDFLCYFPRPQRVICILLKNGKNNILTTSEF